MASSIPRGRRPRALVLAAVVMVGTVLRAGQAPPAPPQVASPQPASPRPRRPPRRHRRQRRRPTSCSKPGCGRCWPPTATPVTPKRRWPACASTRAKGCCGAARPGPALVPGDPEKSALLKVVQHAEGFPRMPRGRAKLPAADIEAIAEWIRDGAVWPAATTDAAPAPAGGARAGHHPGAARVLVVPADPQAGRAGGAERRLAAHRHRSLRAGAARARRPGAGRRRRQAHAAAPRHARI